MMSMRSSDAQVLATSAWKVSRLIATFWDLGICLMCRRTGRTRDSSSDAERKGALGRVDWPPMSRIVAPEEMWDCTVCVMVSRFVGDRTPPSEKESGVILRIDISWVRRCGFVGDSGGKEEETWIMGYIGSEGFVMALKAVLISIVPFELGLLLRGLKL